MKSTKEVQELRNKDQKELLSELKTAERKFTELRMNQKLNKLKNVHEITNTRKKIARLWTIMTEKLIEQEKKQEGKNENRK